MSVAAPARPVGTQAPRFMSVPPGTQTSTGDLAVKLAAMAGLDLDPWQQLVLRHSLAERADGKFAALEVGLVCARQNGKGSILEARELAGLFLLNERLIIHSAHLFDTSLEAFDRLVNLIEETPDLKAELARNGVQHGHGKEGVRLKNGNRVRFRTRTKGGGRGFTADCVILDEAMYLPEQVQGALMPTLSARPNPQIWYTGSAVDQEVHDDGLVLSRVRHRGLSGKEERLAFFEWSADLELTDPALREKSGDPGLWADANPSLGISPDHGLGFDFVGVEHASMAPRTFAVERLSVGDWPDPDATDSPIALEQWAALGVVNAPKAAPPLMFAVDMTPLRTRTSIVVVGGDETPRVEVVEAGTGSDWVVARCLELQARHQPLGFVIDQRGAAGSLIADLKDAGIEPIVPSTVEVTQACGMFHDAVRDGKLSHRHDPELTAAVRGAAIRPLGDAWAWARRGTTTDISPLVAATLAHWGWFTRRGQARAVDLNVW